MIEPPTTAFPRKAFVLFRVWTGVQPKRARTVGLRLCWRAGGSMKPDDDNGKLPTDQRPFRVLVISGSDRRQYNCPGVDSKSRTLMLRMAGRLPQEWEIDYEDLGNVYARARIQSCNA